MVLIETFSGGLNKEISLVSKTFTAENCNVVDVSCSRVEELLIVK